MLKTFSVFIALVLGLPLPAEADEQGPPNDTTSTEASATQADESATGNAWSTQGGGVIGASRHVGTVGIGYPGLRGMVHLPLGADFEIAPSVWLNYGFASSVTLSPSRSNTGFYNRSLCMYLWQPIPVSCSCTTRDSCSALNWVCHRYCLHTT